MCFFREPGPSIKRGGGNNERINNIGGEISKYDPEIIVIQFHIILPDIIQNPHVPFPYEYGDGNKVAIRKKKFPIGIELVGNNTGQVRYGYPEYRNHHN
jgi:hypothetical protein